MKRQDENLLETMKSILVGVIEDKLVPVYKRLDNIDTKLHNHLEHTAMNIGQINSDIAWLKSFAEKGFGQQKNGNGDKINAGQEVNIEWLKWGFRLIVGTLIVNIIGIVFLLITHK